jgi:hypothetical protein
VWRLCWCGVDDGIDIDRIKHVAAIRMNTVFKVRAIPGYALRAQPGLQNAG